MKFKFLLLFLFGFLFINNTANANIKIVYIDTSLLIQKSNAAIKINKKLQGIHNANISKFTSIEKKLFEEREDLLKQKKIINKDDFKKKALSLQKKIENLNLEKKKAITNLNTQKTKAESVIRSQLKNILDEYSKLNSISLIIDKKNVVNGLSSLDITTDIIKVFNDKVKKINIK